jgi:Ni,Fe-hydrogenase III large subunit
MDFPVSVVASGDVFARSMVRYMELKTSFETIRRFVTDLPENERPVTETGPKSFAPPLVADALCVSLVEGWRGEICHTALTGPDGQFTRYKVVDPSFHNWPGLQMALRDQQISDFPLNNKSFNQSYCGFDL